MYKRVYPREKYLSKIRPFFHSDIIKVITGIRRCGKSFIIKGIINALLSGGIGEDQIIYIPLDNKGYKNIKTPQQLEERKVLSSTQMVLKTFMYGNSATVRAPASKILA